MLVLVGAVLVVWPAAAPEVVDVVDDCRTFFVANPTKNVSDPSLVLFAPNCLMKHMKMPNWVSMYGNDVRVNIAHERCTNLSYPLCPPGDHTSTSSIG